jgi:hypothetical protein
MGESIRLNKTVQFVCHIHSGRKKAIEAAVIEMLCLLRDLSPAQLLGGPLAEQGGVFWMEIPEVSVDEALDRFPRLGYTKAVDKMEVLHRMPPNDKGIVRWRKRYFRLVRVYQEDRSLLRDQAPDRREFVLVAADGSVRTTKGYRGNGTNLERRGLPVCDARLLVNITRPDKPRGMRFLDPFGGAGGIALEALASGLSVFTTDIDVVVSQGLKQFGAYHGISDVRHPGLPRLQQQDAGSAPGHRPGQGARRL